MQPNHVLGSVYRGKRYDREFHGHMKHVKLGFQLKFLVGSLVEEDIKLHDTDSKDET